MASDCGPAFQLDDAALQRCVLRPQARRFTVRGRGLQRKCRLESAKLPDPIYQLPGIGAELQPTLSGPIRLVWLPASVMRLVMGTAPFGGRGTELGALRWM